MSDRTGVSVLGIFVADTSYVAKRLPKMGETMFGSGFSLGPGGKGSNQAVAAAKAGAETFFISKIGKDPFGEMAIKAYTDSGVQPRLAIMDDMPTGAAFIFVNEDSGSNAIIVHPGAAGTISVQDVEDQRECIENSTIFVTQLEQPAHVAQRGLEIAKNAGVRTVFNPAPVSEFSDDVYRLCDYVVPNEVEAEALVGFPIETNNDAARASEFFLERGVGAVLITLGKRGVWYHSTATQTLIPSMPSGKVVDTSGAGDAFVGGFVASLAAGNGDIESVRFGCATAGISITRVGTASAMPTLIEITENLKPVRTSDR